MRAHAASCHPSEGSLPQMQPISTFLRCALVAASLLSGLSVSHAQYLGVTLGFDYSNDLAGPNDSMHNTPLFNSSAANKNATWDNWAEELAASGVDFVCPNLRGSFPNTGPNPEKIGPFLTALQNRGLTKRIKLAIFDDNASSWTAQWNQANGRGFGYAQPFDMADPANLVYLWDYNYKKFYQTVPDESRFKINGRPVIIIWTGNRYFLGNMQGNVSVALNYIRQQCQSTFGFNPFIILSGDFLQNDTTLQAAGVVDGIENWFVAGQNSWSLATLAGVKIGALCPQFQSIGVGGYIDPQHGQTLANGLINTRGAGALLTLVEGFSDWEEDAALFRVRNRDATGASVGYAATYYDYPNQRINLLRKYGNAAFPPELKFEFEGCDEYGGAAGGNGKTNFFRNGNIAIEATTDPGGGYNVGWIVVGEWFEWKDVPIQGRNVRFQVRVASPNDGGYLHFVIDGVSYPVIAVPNTGGWQTYTTVQSEAYPFAKGGTHTVRVVCDTSGFNLNYWQYRNALPLGGTVSLQSMANSLWVTASVATTPLIASKSTPAGSEQFQVVDQSAAYWYGCVALQSLGTGMFVSADPAGITGLRANQATVGANEVFQWVDHGDGTVSLRALANQKSVTAENAGAQALVNNRTDYGLWETFTLKVWSTGNADPLPASDFSAVALSESQLQLTWTKSATVGASYVIRRSPRGMNNWTIVAAPGAGSTTYLVADLAASTSYDFSLQAVNTSGTSPFVTITAATPAGIGDGIPGWWRLQYFGNGLTLTSSSGRDQDPDGDVMTNFQEYTAGTNPLDPASVLRLEMQVSGRDITLSFASVPGKTYVIERAAALGATTSWTIVADNISGTGATISIVDSNALDQSTGFYRVRLK